MRLLSEAYLLGKARSVRPSAQATVQATVQHCSTRATVQHGSTRATVQHGSTRPRFNTVQHGQETIPYGAKGLQGADASFSCQCWTVLNRGPCCTVAVIEWPEATTRSGSTSGRRPARATPVSARRECSRAAG